MQTKSSRDLAILGIGAALVGMTGTGLVGSALWFNVFPQDYNFQQAAWVNVVAALAWIYVLFCLLTDWASSKSKQSQRLLISTVILACVWIGHYALERPEIPLWQPWVFIGAAAAPLAVGIQILGLLIEDLLEN